MDANYAQISESFYQFEDDNGVRFSWNNWPATKVEAAKIVIPLGALYSPFLPLQNKSVNYEPISCKGKNCHAILNPYCEVNVNSKVWTCPFCYQTNQFPPLYASISENNLPAELIQNFSTIEYVLPRRQPSKLPVFLFVIDICMIEEDLNSLKEAILMSLSTIPEDASVGLITFGTNIQVYELAHQVCSKSYVFRGDGKGKLTPQKLQKLLGFAPQVSNKNNKNNQVQFNLAAAKQQKYLVPLKDCEMSLETILEELQPDPHKQIQGERAKRATGVAMSVAISLLENICPNSAARIMTFLGGPCTLGPGAIVSLSQEEFIRAHHDIIDDKAKHLVKAAKYYESLANRAVRNGHVIDIFAASLDQVGLLEMQSLFNKTGGLVVMADAFDSPMFTESFQQLFERAPENEQRLKRMAFNAGLQVHTSKEIKINGCVGQCDSLKKKALNVSENMVGAGGTCAWRICGLDVDSTLAFYFEIANQQATAPAGFIQFQTHYVNSIGQEVLRVTTCARKYADPNLGLQGLANGFDQEAAAVLMARLAALRAKSQSRGDVMRWLDRALVRLSNKFATYIKGDPHSWNMSQLFILYPRFMFHLRRSPILEIFNCSPDETCFIRHTLCKQNTPNAITMIQPTLISYQMGKEPDHVLLSSKSILPNCVLVLDTFFQVVVWTGKHIAEWRNKGYQNKPEYAHLKSVLEGPSEYIENSKIRFPYPRLVEADEGTSQARFLTAVVDPHNTHNSNEYGSISGEAVIMTDDVNLDVFMDHLKKLSVQS